jgi:hypothetical protein
MPDIPADVINTILGVGIAILCGVLLLAILFTILRYVSFTALVRMADRYEDSGEKVSVRDGFRLGWSRGAFRTWLVDLLFGLASLVVVLLLGLVAGAPLLLWLTGEQTAGVVGTVIAVALGFLFILLLIVVAIAVSILLQLVYRAVMLEGMGVMDGIRRGWALFRRRLGDVIIMGLILFGIGLVFTVLMIPLVLVLLLAGVVVAGLPALLAGAITNIFAQGNLPPIIAAAVGLPILFAVLIVPLVIVGGLFETFKTNVWTLAYRELIALEFVPAVEA